MRDALDRWTRDTNDLGLIKPESKLVRENLWPPNGDQPFTAAPHPVVRDGLLTITCETDGASIGYRKIDSGNETPWKVYTAPVQLDAGGGGAGPSSAGGYEAVAHRIGYRRSPVVQVMQRE